MSTVAKAKLFFGALVDVITDDELADEFERHNEVDFTTSVGLHFRLCYTGGTPCDAGHITLVAVATEQVVSEHDRSTTVPAALAKVDAAVESAFDEFQDELDFHRPTWLLSHEVF